MIQDLHHFITMYSVHLQEICATLVDNGLRWGSRNYFYLGIWFFDFCGNSRFLVSERQFALASRAQTIRVFGVWGYMDTLRLYTAVFSTVQMRA